MILHKSRPASLRPLRPRSRLGTILVSRRADAPGRGKLLAGGCVIPCALGRSGITHRKREGDGATPAGRFRIVGLWQRVDRLPPVRTGVPRRAIRRDDGWCDDPGLPAYNRPIRLPAKGSHERLWREDRLYDLVLTLDHNLDHPRKGLGSAIFFHIAREDFQPTAGCVAVRPDAMRRLLPRLSRRARLVVQA